MSGRWWSIDVEETANGGRSRTVGAAWRGVCFALAGIEDFEDCKSFFIQRRLKRHSLLLLLAQFAPVLSGMRHGEVDPFGEVVIKSSSTPTGQQPIAEAVLWSGK